MQVEILFLVFAVVTDLGAENCITLSHDWAKS